MIQITLKFTNYRDAAAVLARLSEGCIGAGPVDNTGDYVPTVSIADVGQPPDYVAPSTAEPAKRTRKAKAAEEPRSEEQKAAAGAAMHAAARVDIPQVTHSEPVPAADKAIDYATEVAPLITRAANNPAIGPSKTLAILQSYGARKGSEVPPERLGDLKLELEEALAAAEVAA